MYALYIVSGLLALVASETCGNYNLSQKYNITTPDW